MGRSFARCASAVALAAGLLAACWGPAGASVGATGDATIRVSSGGLTVTTQSGSVDFGTVSLSGLSQIVHAAQAPTFRVMDASGTSAGWSVTFTATDFTDGGANAIASRDFIFNPSGGIIRTVDGQPVDAANGPRETGGGPVDLATSRKILTTAPGFGRGIYDYTPQAAEFSLTLPSNAIEGLYTSTLTATVASGP